MSGPEDIEKIKELSAEDKAKVVEFLRKSASEQSGASPRVMEDVVFKKAADAAFSKHDELLKKLAL